MSNDPNLIPTTISALSGLISAIFMAIAILVRRRSKDGRRQRLLEEQMRAAYSYIYLLEMATDELCRKTGFRINIKKPDELKSSFLVDEKDNDLEELAKRLLDKKDDGKRG